MVIWMIGQYSSGKSTLGRAMVAYLKKNDSRWLHIDGDDFREIMGGNLGYTIEERKVNSDRICRFCKYIESQEIPVVCSVLSIFEEARQWNREHLKDYREVYLKVSQETIKRRDPKGLYKAACEGQIKNFVGIDIEFIPPQAPNLVIENDQDRTDVKELALSICQDLNLIQSQSQSCHSERSEESRPSA